MTTALPMLVVGLVLLVAASDRLVVAAARISRALGLSAILIGALVVGLGTSAPELLVSAFAAADGRTDVGVANVIGSNVANVTLVLGVAAMVAPLAARARTLMREAPLMLLGALLFGVVVIDGELERVEAGILLFAMLVAVYLLVRWSLEETDGVDEEVEELIGATTTPLWREIVIGLVALGITLAGAQLVLDGALAIGEELGLSVTFLGLILGVGTSLPELSTAVAAARRDESDLVIGNVLGSNLFNALAVAGTAGMIGPGHLGELSQPTVVYMLAVAIVAGFFATTSRKIVAVEGSILVAAFVAYFALTV